MKKLNKDWIWDDGNLNLQIFSTILFFF